MKNKGLFYFFVFASVLILSGCVARTYPLTRDRVDQDLNAGNRGYLVGKAPQETAARKDTRTVRVFEIELGMPYKAKTNVQAPLAAPAVTAPQALPEQTAVSQEPGASMGQKYIVGKNDTLQKISKKFYGTTRNWMRIYEANKNVLKGPDKVYPGQELNIPQLPEAKQASQELKEPKENLK